MPHPGCGPEALCLTNHTLFARDAVTPQQAREDLAPLLERTTAD
ncbi:hypothetical protein [Streptomyces sp. NPDC006527]